MLSSKKGESENEAPTPEPGLLARPAEKNCTSASAIWQMQQCTESSTKHPCVAAAPSPPAVRSDVKIRPTPLTSPHLRVFGFFGLACGPPVAASSRAAPNAALLTRSDTSPRAPPNAAKAEILPPSAARAPASLRAAMRPRCASQAEPRSQGQVRSRRDPSFASRESRPPSWVPHVATVI